MAESERTVKAIDKAGEKQGLMPGWGPASQTMAAISFSLQAG
jgi:hypothetical protein